MYRSFKLSILAITLATPIAFAGNLPHSQIKYAHRMMAKKDEVTITKDIETAKKEYENIPGIKVSIPVIYYDVLLYGHYADRYELTREDILYEKLHLDFGFLDYVDFPYMLSHLEYTNSGVDESRSYFEFKVSDKALFEIDGKSIPVIQLLRQNNIINYHSLAILDYKNHISETILDAGIIEAKEGKIKIIENN